MGSNFSEVERSITHGHIDFHLEEFGCIRENIRRNQRSNIPLVEFAGVMCGEWIMVAGSQSLNIIIIDSDTSVHGSNPIVVMFNEIKQLVFAWRDNGDVQLIDDSGQQLWQDIIVPVGAFEGDSSASIKEPWIGDSGVHGMVPEVFPVGDAGNPIIGIGIREHKIVSWEVQGTWEPHVI